MNKERQSICKGDHKFVRILSRRNPMVGYRVVRWCEKCGAIVIDGESDNRTYPGKYAEVRLPSE